MQTNSFIWLLAATVLVGGCVTTQPKTSANTPVAAPTAKKSGLPDFDYPPIKTDLPLPKRVTLSNGIRLLLMPDHELPLFSLSAFIKTGSIWEPGDKRGLGTLTGATIRSGGTTNHSPDELDEILETIAASVEIGISDESGSASLAVLARDIDIGLELFADVVQNPAFDESRFELARAQMIDGIRRENDDPTAIALRELKGLIYQGTPYAARPTIESVSSITIDDARAFHKKYFTPQNMILGVLGDFDETTIVEQLEAALGGWTGHDSTFPPVDRVKEVYKKSLHLANKKLPQAVIRIGHLGIRRTDPDYAALRVMDEILGGNGFSSRLTQEIRSVRGLAYSVWSYYIGGRWEMGRFMMGAETKTESTAEVIDVMLAEVNRIRTEPVTDAELDVAKNSIINSFVFIFDTPGRMLGQWLTSAYYNFPDSYLLDYRDRIMKVTREDVLRVAAKYLHPDGLKIVLVGDADKLTPAIKKFGAITPIVLTDHNDPALVSPSGHGH